MTLKQRLNGLWWNTLIYMFEKHKYLHHFQYINSLDICFRELFYTPV